jgi:ribonucleoside-diphosphate reductase alpha chain
VSQAVLNNISETSMKLSNLTENALQVCKDRYLAKENGEIVETVEQMFRRIAKAVAKAEITEEKQQESEEHFFEVLSSLKFLPNSPTLMNAGKSFGMLSACFVLPIEDDLEGIIETQADISRVQRAGGGTGFTLDRLRASGSYIKSSGGTTSGPISFWRAYSESTHAIQQGAFRRGANMMMMSVSHPDIIKFLFAKQNLSQFENYNISIKITDSFMGSLGKNEPAIFVNPQTNKRYCMPLSVIDTVKEAVDLGKKHQKYIRKIDNCYTLANLIDLDDNRIEDFDHKFVTNDVIFDLITKNAWQTGEPGVVFIDRIRETEPTPKIGKIEASNPCGEQFLLPNEACNLGSINVAHDDFLPVKQGEFFASVEDYKWNRLAKVIYTCIRFLDNVIDVNNYPTKRIHDMCHANRKIGLGVMGVADLLFKLGIPYNSEKANKFLDTLMEFVNFEAMIASEELADEKGAFPNWSDSIYYDLNRPMRNAEVTTVAPTGTISIVANCSGGIEPMFSLAFQRNVLDGKQLWEVNSNFERVLKIAGCYSDEILQRIAREGTIKNIKELTQEIRDVYVCARDIDPEWHVIMQATAQRHVTNSISKTCNLPTEATVDKVKDIFEMAWNKGCKAITVYRDRCRENQPMALLDDKPIEKVREVVNYLQVVEDKKIVPVKTDDLEDTDEVLPSIRIRQNTVFGHLHVKIAVDPNRDKELEIFAQLGHAGSVEQADLEAICRLASLMLRAGFSLMIIVNQLLRINTSIYRTDNSVATSLPKGIANALLKYLKLKSEFGLQGLLTGSHLVKQSASISTQTLPPDYSAILASNKAIRACVPLPVDQGVTGYKVICPKGEGNCDGQIVREGTCQYCVKCGASSC